ncbi:MAG TPA: TonB-dependent receptor [Sphingomonas sp.]|jgi:outer membrane receptor protein involved in Fe transport
MAKLLTTGAILFSAGAASAQDGAARTVADAAVQAEADKAQAGVVDAADPARDAGDAVIVTGTRIQRPNTTSAAPVTSVLASDIRAQAAVNVEEVLNRLPQVAPDSQQNYADSDGRQRIKLRNLGFERTLVLIDGQRIGTQNGQDVNIIPTSLLERVDVLSGGASSVYGSDAVAGVVNFILKKDFEGIELNSNYNFYTHDNRAGVVTPVARASAFPTVGGTSKDGGRVDVTLTVGKRLFDDALRVSGFVNYRHSDVIPYGSRENGACYLLQTVKDGPLTCQLSTYSPSGYIQPGSGASSGQQLVNNPDGSRTFVPYGVGVGNAANPFDGYSYQRQSERINAGGFVTLKLADAAELYGSGIWFRDKSFNRFPPRVLAFSAYGGTPYQVNCNNPFLSGSQATTLCGAQAGTGATVPIDVRYRFEGLPQVLDTYINSGTRATAGIRGDFADAWHYDVGGVYAHNRQDITFGNFPDFDRVNRSLNVVTVNGVPTCSATVSGVDPACVPFDAFRAGNADPALANYLFAARSGTTTGVGTLYDATANLTGDLGTYGITSPLAEQGVAIAVGAEYRVDTYRSFADATYREQNGGSDYKLRQSVREANVEVQVPLIEKQSWTHLLQLNAGLRVSRYNTNPQTFTTWKLEGVFAPIEDITFRGSYNKAQRAPTVIEIRQATQNDFGTQGGLQNDFCAPVPRQIADPNNPGQVITTTAPLASREVCAATGLADALYGSPTLLCPDNACTVRTGGFTVDPETAYTKTIGIILKPRFVPRLVFSVDRFLIDLKDSIGYNDYSYYQNGCLSSGLPYFCSLIVRNPDGTLYSPPASNPTTGFIGQGTSNAYKTKAHGWDFQGQYTLRTERYGIVDWSFNGTLTTLAGGQDSPILPKRNCVGYYGNGCGQLIPKWAHTLRTTYTLPGGAFGVSLNWRHTGKLTNASNSGDPALGYTADGVRTTFAGISAQDYFDLAFNFSVGKQFGFRIAANNLLDKTAPVIPNSYDISLSRNNTIPQRYDTLGRNIAVGATVRF